MIRKKLKWRFCWKNHVLKKWWTLCEKDEIDRYRAAGSQLGKIHMLKERAYKSKLLKALLGEVA